MLCIVVKGGHANKIRVWKQAGKHSPKCFETVKKCEMTNVFCHFCLKRTNIFKKLIDKRQKLYYNECTQI